MYRVGFIEHDCETTMLFLEIVAIAFWAAIILAVVFTTRIVIRSIKSRQQKEFQRVEETHQRALPRIRGAVTAKTLRNRPIPSITEDNDPTWHIPS